MLNFAAPPALPLIFACNLSFPVGLEISLVVNFALQSLNL
jgi:hypothetical protein